MTATMELRLFNEDGIARLERFIQDLRDGKRLAPQKRNDILTAPGLSAVARPEAPITVEQRAFPDSKQAMDYLYGKLSGGGGMRHIGKDKYLWSWLALFYFEQLCPPGGDGKRKVGQSARWIPEFHRNRQFFHLLLGPYLAYLHHRNDLGRARVLFCHRPDQSSPAVTEIGCRQELITCNAVVEAASRLYVGADGKFKRGAHGRSGLRRFVQVIQQFARTWDLYSMPTAALLDMLPGEFDRFRR
ncbi:MAG: hypothetical protein OXU43_00060 [Gammaproteobacteria bacterium]|nr:hypothetical protein [Gammaproteobacteria bacterium]